MGHTVGLELEAQMGLDIPVPYKRLLTLSLQNHNAKIVSTLFFNLKKNISTFFSM